MQNSKQNICCKCSIYLFVSNLKILKVIDWDCVGMAYELSYNGELAQVKDKAQCVCWAGGIQKCEDIMTWMFNDWQQQWKHQRNYLDRYGPSSNFENRVHDLVVSDLPSETKWSQFESGC